MDSLLPYSECKNIIKPFLVRVVTKNEIYFKIEEDDYDLFLNNVLHVVQYGFYNCH